jgi:predicted nucleic-acid-binding protein
MLIDTNVILRHVLADDPVQTLEARNIFAPIRAGDAQGHILHAALAECVYVLERELSITSRSIAEVLSEVLRYPGIIGERLDIALRAFEHFASTPLSFVDSLTLAHVELDKIELATFDKKLRSLASKAIQLRNT